MSQRTMIGSIVSLSILAMLAMSVPANAAGITREQAAKECTVEYANAPAGWRQSRIDKCVRLKLRRK
jgi:hypothetical protein